MATRFNYGHGITIVLLVFIGFLGTALVKSLQMEHTLVAQDYYAEDLQYQNTLDRMNRAIDAGKGFRLEWDQENSNHWIVFTDNSGKKGTIDFYRASNKSYDFTQSFSGKQRIEVLKSIAPGKWTITVTWKEGEEEYLMKKTVTLGLT